MSDPWVVWAYALRPGWERAETYRTREEARDLREFLVTENGYPPEFVSIRRESKGVPGRRPRLEVIEQVRVALAAGADR